VATASRQKLKTFHFVVYLGGVRGITRRLQDRVYEAGSDDAALVSQNGKIFLDFDREAYPSTDNLGKGGAARWASARLRARR
jgi:hypothetical protein